MQPAVSVIVPNYNHAPFLRQRIGSILEQTFQDFELILLDDCSTDGSREILESYCNNPRVSYIEFNTANSGSPFCQWGKGIGMAKGEWVWVAESDDWAEPQLLERLITEADKVSDSVLAFCATRWVDASGAELWPTRADGRVKVTPGNTFIKSRMASCNAIANVSQCIFRRRAFRQEEIWRYEHMRLCGDWLFYVLLAMQGSVVEVGELLNNYRQHGSNTSDSAERQGLTFTEGVDVLDYMIEHCGLERSDYATAWGKLWARYYKQYDFSTEVAKKVWNTMAKRHSEVIPSYLIHRLLQR